MQKFSLLQTYAEITSIDAEIGQLLNKKTKLIHKQVYPITGSEKNLNFFRSLGRSYPDDRCINLPKEYTVQDLFLYCLHIATREKVTIPVEVPIVGKSIMDISILQKICKNIMYTFRITISSEEVEYGHTDTYAEGTLDWYDSSRLLCALFLSKKYKYNDTVPLIRSFTNNYIFEYNLVKCILKYL